MIPLEEVHPALVHFPVVFILCAFVLDAFLVSRRQDLAERTCLVNLALALWVLAALTAGVAAFFGDVALDRAVARGFPVPPMELHEELAVTTLSLAALLAAVRALAWWRGVRLSAGRAWLVLVGGTVVVGLLLVTAYHGGELVYRLGVNVAAVRPG